MREPTTEAHIRAAEDAYDTASAESAVAFRKLREAVTDSVAVQEAMTAYLAAQAQLDYAWAVWRGTLIDSGTLPGPDPRNRVPA
jgi:hypothetical protein